MKEIAAEIMGVKPKMLKPFDVPDFYNDNTIQGFICLKSDHKYGSLVITSVNHQETRPQYIRCMPKIRYPFTVNDKAERIYHWPKDWKEFAVYEKYDGTNITRYTYIDSNGTRYTTCKTRLTPVIKSSDLYGDFLGMWNSCRERQLEIDQEELIGDVAVCYEIYGYRNPHLVKYDVDIKAVEILRVRQSDGAILLPKNFASTSLSDNSIEETYNIFRENDEKANEGLEEGDFVIEGKVFYITSDREKWIPVKCKPECIEKIHWSRGTIDYSSIYTTVLNSLEHLEYTEISMSTIEPLLLEEYSTEQIENSTSRIEKAIHEVTTHAKRVVRVKKLMASVTFNKASRKQHIMQYLSQYFPKRDMRQVFNAVRELGFVE